MEADTPTLAGEVVNSFKRGHSIKEVGTETIQTASTIWDN